MTADDTSPARVAAAAEASCGHPFWTEEGDGHGHNYWRCTKCGKTQWIAPWILRGGR